MNSEKRYATCHADGIWSATVHTPMLIGVAFVSLTTVALSAHDASSAFSNAAPIRGAGATAGARVVSGRSSRVERAPAAPAAQAPAISAEDKALALSLSQALGAWMARDRAAKGGRFLLYDAAAQEVLDLTPAKLDDGDHLHRLSDGRFLSWGEFRDVAGRKFMLDFYFTRSGHSFTFDNEISIYSREGTRRYAWDETGPTMKKTGVPTPSSNQPR